MIQQPRKGLIYLRGPEIECWIGVEDGRDPAVENDWSLLPFMALSDGAHAYVFLGSSVERERSGIIRR